MSIQTHKIGFTNLEYTLTALPIVPFLSLTDFAEDGVKWEDVDLAEMKKGADGQYAINNKANVKYTGMFTFLPNAGCRPVLDKLADLSAVRYGRKLVDFEIILTVINNTTNSKTVYSGGVIAKASAGDSAGAEGQENKSYTIDFAEKIMLPI